MRDELGRYYTPEDVARTLVGMVRRIPRTVVDLGCGQGALMKAAAARWSGLEISSFDVDNVEPTAPEGCASHEHRQCDLLEGDCRAELACSGRKAELVLLNPPFGVNRHYQSQAPGSFGAAARRAEYSFLELATMLAATSGTIAAILPATFVSSARLAKVRGELAGHCANITFKGLPSRTFSGTEANAVLVIAEVGEGPAEVTILDEDDADVAKSCSVMADEWIDGVGPMSGRTLRALGATVSRGRIPSNRTADFPGTFHTSHFANAAGGRVAFGSTEPGDQVAASAGDILIARVGRRLEENVVMVEHGTAPLSDCVLRLRFPAEHRDTAFAFLRSREGAAQLRNASGGLAARHLPMTHLLDRVRICAVEETVVDRPASSGDTVDCRRDFAAHAPKTTSNSPAPSPDGAEGGPHTTGGGAGHFVRESGHVEPARDAA